MVQSTFLQLVYILLTSIFYFFEISWLNRDIYAAWMKQKEKKNKLLYLSSFLHQSALTCSALFITQRITLQHEGRAGPPTEQLQLTCISQEDSFMCCLYNTP